MGDGVNINLRLSGLPEQVIKSMIEAGYATSKTEAIRLALLQFSDRNKQDLEDELVVKKMQKIDEEIMTGKRKVLTEQEALGNYAKYLG